MKFSEHFAKLESNWRNQDRWRQLSAPQGIDFCSNDYLGFALRQDLRAKIINRLQESTLGSTGSRLLRGHNEHTEKFESRLALFSNCEASLFFPSGYQANLALFSGLLRQKAVVFSDERNHASIIDGIRLSGCEKYIWPHNDLNHLEMLLKQKVRSDSLNVVAVESIYSMIGDFAPLQELVELCEKYGACLIVDEAHATGLYGYQGGGRVDALGLNKRVFAKVHTAGKALGVSGAWVAGPKALMSLLVNQSRPFIYSTAPAAYQQVACDEAISTIVSEYSQLKIEFQNKILRFQRFLLNLTETTSCQVSGYESPITALICGRNDKALGIANALKKEGFDVRAIRPPSVPEGGALLRLTLPLSRTEAEISSLQKVLTEVLAGSS